MRVLQQAGVFFEEMDLLAISDLQFGYEAVLQAQGIHVPVSQYAEVEVALRDMLRATHAKRVLINGDVKHHFSRPHQQEWEEVLSLLRFLKSKRVQTIFVRGNHDAFLGKILRDQEMRLVDAYQESGYLFVHGHRLLSDYPGFRRWKPFHTLVIGHVHPAVSIRDEIGVAHKFKCLLRGKYRDQTLIVLPSLSPLASGFDVTRSEKEKEFVSPIMEQCQVGDMVPFVIDREVGVKEFPKVKHLQ
ncbi:metallophosphoesterase [Candidatus Micrarchaeota archaeon]|nr:metallophosphoesterase [Candidatus Micrarchaeota archaeon]